MNCGIRIDCWRWLLAPVLIFICVIIGMCAITSIIAEEQGGTDQYITIDGEAGGPGENGWRIIHGFIILENESIVLGSMNITIAENAKWNGQKEDYVPAGHIFGSLENITWDQEPEPFIEIKPGDFEIYREDDHNLTITILGEYYRKNGNESERRTAFREITITEPYRAPIPILHVTVAGNWTWVNASEGEKIVVPIPDSSGILHMNASMSYDPDGNPITEWTFLKNDASVLLEATELPVNGTITLSADKDYRIVFECVDETGMNSDALIFFIRLSNDHLLPNLSFTNYAVSTNPESINEVTYLNLTIKNSGAKLANYADIYYFINDAYQFYKTIDRILPGENITISFTFSGDTIGIYTISFEIRDDGEAHGELLTFFISVGQHPPLIHIESHKNNSRINGSHPFSGTVNFDGLYDEVTIEISIDGGEWMWVTNSTQRKYWDFILPPGTLTTGPHTIRFRAYDGIFHGEIETLNVIVIDEESTDESRSYPDPSVIAGGFVLMGSVGILGLSYLREDFRLLLYTSLTLPLYSKLRKDDIMKEGNRQDLFELILSKPGTNLTTLQREMNIGYGTLVHHLSVLEKNKMIHSRKEFGRRLFFPVSTVGSSITPAVPYELSLVQKKIMGHLRTCGPKARWEIGSELGLKQQTVSYTIQRLEKMGQVTCDGTGKGSLCYATDNT